MSNHKLHFLKISWYGGKSRRRCACRPSYSDMHPLPEYVTEDTSLVTCKSCLRTRYYKRHASGELGRSVR